MIYTSHYDSPLGGITLAADRFRLTGLWFDGQKYFGDTLPENFEKKNLPVFEETFRWLDIYFSGKAPDFTPPLFMETTPFRKSVWEIMEKSRKKSPFKRALQECLLRQLVARLDTIQFP